MIGEDHQRLTLRAKLRAAALSRLGDLHFDEPLGRWPVNGPLQSPRRMRAIVAGIADAARDIDPDCFVDSDEDKRTITRGIMVMTGRRPTVVIAVRFTKRAVQVDRSTIPLTVPHAGELILGAVLEAVTDAMLTA
jgi:hypothetical protein